LAIGLLQISINKMCTPTVSKWQKNVLTTTITPVLQQPVTHYIHQSSPLQQLQQQQQQQQQFSSVSSVYSSSSPITPTSQPFIVNANISIPERVHSNASNISFMSIQTDSNQTEVGYKLCYNFRKEYYKYPTRQEFLAQFNNILHMKFPHNTDGIACRCFIDQVDNYAEHEKLLQCSFIIFMIYTSKFHYVYGPEFNQTVNNAMHAIRKSNVYIAFVKHFVPLLGGDGNIIDKLTGGVGAILITPPQHPETPIHQPLPTDYIYTDNDNRQSSQVEEVEKLGPASRAVKNTTGGALVHYGVKKPINQSRGKGDSFKMMMMMEGKKGKKNTHDRNGSGNENGKKRSKKRKKNNTQIDDETSTEDEEEDDDDDDDDEEKTKNKSRNRKSSDYGEIVVISDDDNDGKLLREAPTLANNEVVVKEYNDDNVDDDDEEEEEKEETCIYIKKRNNSDKIIYLNPDAIIDDRYYNSNNIVIDLNTYPQQQQQQQQQPKHIKAKEICSTSHSKQAQKVTKDADQSTTLSPNLRSSSSLSLSSKQKSFPTSMIPLRIITKQKEIYLLAEIIIRQLKFPEKFKKFIHELTVCPNGSDMMNHYRKYIGGLFELKEGSEEVLLTLIKQAYSTVGMTASLFERIIEKSDQIVSKFVETFPLDLKDFDNVEMIEVDNVLDCAIIYGFLPYSNELLIKRYKNFVNLVGKYDSKDAHNYAATRDVYMAIKTKHNNEEKVRNECFNLIRKKYYNDDDDTDMI